VNDRPRKPREKTDAFAVAYDAVHQSLPQRLADLPLWTQLVIVVLVLTAVMGLRSTLSSFDLAVGRPYLLFVLPIVVGAVLGGWLPGLVATALSLYWVISLDPELSVMDPSERTAAILFFFEGVFVTWLGAVARNAAASAREAAADLERKVAVRTAELAQVNARLLASNQALQEFASVASHDLQEPLRKIQAFGGRLANECADALDDSGRTYLQRMTSASARMARLIEDLLQYSRITTQAAPLADVDMAAVAREVIDDLQVRIEDTGAQVDVSALPTIRADRSQMYRLLLNLVSNALKFRRPEVDPVISITHEDDPAADMVEIRVRDNGIGFAPQYAERIFEVFERLHGRNAYEGTGIGLAVCQKIVQRHAGTLRAESDEGQGATFMVRLPRGHDPAAATVVDEPADDG
jgi:signal transduction histidine kinase